MKIEHIAIWTNRLQDMRDFYVEWFAAKASDFYENKQKQFKSCFLTFASGARLELMTTVDLKEEHNTSAKIGLAHFCISVGSKDNVDAFTEKCRQKGIMVKGEPRTTGDGYYESIILDPDGNQVEISI